MEEWQNGHDQPGYHYHQEQERKPVETPGKRLEDVGTAPDQMGDRNRRRYGSHGSHDDGIYEDTLSDAGSIRGVDV